MSQHSRPELGAVEIVQASSCHITTLSELGKQTYEATFIGVSYYTKELVEDYTRCAFSPESIAAAIQDPHILYLLLRVNQQPAGYARLRERQTPACLQGVHAIALERLYLLPAFQKLGLGVRLLDRSYDEARLRGYRYLWLSVWEHNQAGIAFYHRQGFQKAGQWDWKFHSLGKDYVDQDFVMIIPIPSSPRQLEEESPWL